MHTIVIEQFCTITNSLCMYVCMHVKTSFRKAEHECSIGKRGHILVNLGQFKVETLLNSIQICRV